MGDEGIPFNFQGRVNKRIVRSFDDDMCFIRRVNPYKCEIDLGFVPGMNVQNAEFNYYTYFYFHGFVGKGNLLRKFCSPGATL